MNVFVFFLNYYLFQRTYIWKYQRITNKNKKNKKKYNIKSRSNQKNIKTRRDKNNKKKKNHLYTKNLKFKKKKGICLKKSNRREGRIEKQQQ